MASLTATAMPTLGIIKLALDWAPYVTEPVALYRIEPDGRRVEILGSPITLSGSVAIAYDTTAPLDVDLTYEAVLVNPTALRDLFNSRTVSNAWGSPEFTTVAGSWGSSGGVSSDYNVSGGVAQQSVSAVSSARHNTIPMPFVDARIALTAASPVNPLGAGIRTGAITRYLNTSNMYQFNIVHNVSGAITLNIVKRVAGTETVIATTSTPFGVSPNRKFRIVAESVGTRHQMTVWWATGPADGVTLEVSDSALTAAGYLGARTVLLSGNTNTLPLVFTYDSVEVQDLSTYTLTSGTVSVDADPHGWIRDPVEPGNSIRLDNCASHTFDCLTSSNMVFFRGFGDAKYRSTTGVFEVNNAERPVTVAQTRKAPTTDLMFASVTLEDIRRVRSLFRSGRNLSLYLPERYGWGLDTYGADMFTAGDLLESRLNRDDMRKPYRLWAAEIAPTDLDDDLPQYTVGGNGIPIPGATFGDMKATGKTFGQLRDGTIINANPYLEINAANWTAAGGTFVRSTAKFYSGVASGLLTPSGVAAQTSATSEQVAVIPGRTYRAASALNVAVTRGVHLGINWHDAGGVFLSTSVQPDVTLTLNTWTVLAYDAVAPAGAAFGRVYVEMGSTPPNTHLLYADEITLTRTVTFLDLAQGVFS